MDLFFDPINLFFDTMDPYFDSIEVCKGIIDLFGNRNILLQYFINKKIKYKMVLISLVEIHFQLNV